MDKRVKKILIKTKKEVFSSQLGNNISKLKGDGYDFVELREYEEGEDIRKIDWVISAKMNKPYVKVFHVQKQLNINIVALMGGSMHFGTQGFKQDLISQICSILAYATIANQDHFTSYIANESVLLNTQRNRSLQGVNSMVENLMQYDCIGKRVDYKNIFKQLFNTIYKKSLLFLVGDFLEYSQIDLRILAKKHQVIALIVRDRFEENPQEIGNISVKDPATNMGYTFSLDQATINSYKKKIVASDHLLYEHFKKCGIEFTKIYTDENPIIKIMKLFR
ncbi:MAG: DUF58 domain-containing protein [Campylobacterales bacterium]|nr:DUF58 domain-containing protein [Campylobacterales bacterium]